MSSIVPPLMEGVWSRRGHVDLGSRVVRFARALATLQPYPHARVSLQHMVLRKKMYEIRIRYLASDVHAHLLG